MLWRLDIRAEIDKHAAKWTFISGIKHYQTEYKYTNLKKCIWKPEFDDIPSYC